MFVWVELPKGLSADTLFQAALAEKVAFVPGSPFFARDANPRFLRLNYSNRTPELIREGMARLGRVARASI
jgi:2-aminoadipate transaminase